MTNREIATAVAEHIDSENTTVIDDGGNASDNVTVWGDGEWFSTPFQNAGFDLDTLAGWFHGEGGVSDRIAVVGCNGSADIYRVVIDIDEDGDTVISTELDEELPEWCWLDQDVVGVIESYGDAAHGGDIPGVCEDWIDRGFDSRDIDAWLSAEVWDAETAEDLRDNDITPEQVKESGHGYALANGDMTVAEFMEEVAVEED